MQSSNRLFDDVARIFTDAAGAAQGVKREAETLLKAQGERLIRDMDIATREEVDAVAARLRERGLAVADDGATVRTQDPWLNSIAVTVG